MTTAKSRRKKRTFWDLAALFPPILVRLLARHPRGRAMSDQEIADAAMLSYMQVYTISRQMDWSGIDLPTMRRFLTGCRLDFENRHEVHRALIYITQQPKWAHLKKSALWGHELKPLIEEYRRSMI